MDILTETSSTTITTGSALLYAAVAGGLGILIALTYMKTGRVTKHFARTLIVLPLLVLIIGK